MIEIITPCKDRFEAMCPKCGCVLAYNLEDLDSENSFHCPCCNELIKHQTQTPDAPVDPV